MRVRKFLPDLLKESDDTVAGLEKEATKFLVTNTLTTVDFTNRLGSFLVKNVGVMGAYGDGVKIPDAPNVSMLCSILVKDTGVRNFLGNLQHAYRAKKYDRFVFCKDFFNELKDTKLDKIKTGDIIQGCGSVRLPYKITDDIDGAGFDEFMYTNMLMREFYAPDDDALWERIKADDPIATDDGMIWNITWMDSEGAHNYSSHGYTAKDQLILPYFKNTEFKLMDLAGQGLQKIRQEDGYAPHIKAIFNCLAYLKSGDPDLRDTKNEIRYQSSGSTKPVRKDKELSRHNFDLVGYNFKKNPLYTKEFFYQPAYYARRGEAKKVTWCKGSLKRRKDYQPETS